MFYRRQSARVLAFLFSALAVALSAGARPQFGAAGQDAQTARARLADGPQTAQQPSPTPPRRRDNPDITLQDDDEVERVETDLTNLFFSAQDRNRRFVSALKREDIRVLEDGVEQPVFTFQRSADLPLTLAIVIDASASQEHTLPAERDAARSFVDSVIRPQKDEVALLTFTGEATLELGLTGNVARVRRAIERVEFVPPSGYVGGGVTVGTPPISGDNQSLAGSTALWDAVFVTADEVLSESASSTRRAIILITDGVDTSSKVKFKDAVERAIKAEALVYSIGIGDSFNFSGVNEGSLRKLSEQTGGRAYFPRSESDLRAAFQQIQQDLREQYIVAYSPTNKRKDGSFRQVKIEVVNPELRKQDLRLTYRQGYFAKTAPGSSARTR